MVGLEGGEGGLGAAERATPPALLEGWMFKRRRRDSFGVWRCFGESWAKRHFALRGCVLYYYRKPTDRHARGALPIGQCNIDLRPSPYGDYIRLSARFTHRTMRIRGATPEQTSHWLSTLRRAAGLPPLYQLAADVPLDVASTIPTNPEPKPLVGAGGVGGVVDRADGVHGEGRGGLRQMDTGVGFDQVAEGNELSMSQRCSWLYLASQLDFVRSLAQLSEAVYTPGSSSTSVPGKRPTAAVAKAQLRSLLSSLKLPPLAYVPLGPSSSPFCPVLRIPASESSVFVTRERASVLLCVEVERGPRGRKRSQLFEEVRSDQSVFGGLASPSHAAVFLPSSIYAEDLEDEWMQSAPHSAPHSSSHSAPHSAPHSPPHSSLTSTASPDHVPGPNGAPTPTAPTTQPPTAAPPVLAPPTAPAADAAGDMRPGQPGGRWWLDRLYGEPWAAKRERVRRGSPFGKRAGWALVPVISKANDDVRQEVFVMQLLSLCNEAFPQPLWLRPYDILSTGPRSGLIEFLPDTQSLDRLKRTDGFVSLRTHFERAYGGSGSPEFAAAQRNFLVSLAAYSATCYLLAIKDRHNGNIMLDREGHLVHIDFGFVLGKAPGGRASLEASVPFKLTREMVDVLGGESSTLFTDALPQLITAALSAARHHAETILTLVEITMPNSALPCFQAAALLP